MIRVVILIVALGAAGLSAWLLTRMGSTESTGVTAPRVVLDEVLVAATEIAYGQILSEADFRWQEWPQSGMNPAFIRRATKPDAIAEFKGTMARAKIIPGEPVLEGRISKTQSGLLASVLAPGKRALAISVSAESAAGGFILPNDRVDVIQTVTVAGDGGQEIMAKTILSNIKVLAIDQRASDVKDPAFVGKTATLELSPSQAEAISASLGRGQLSLALRSSGDFNTGDVVTPPETGGLIRVFLGDKSEKMRVQ